MSMTTFTGREFTATIRTGRAHRSFVWRIQTEPAWSGLGKRFVWAEIQRPLCGHRLSTTRMPWNLAELPEPLRGEALAADGKSLLASAR